MMKTLDKALSNFIGTFVLLLCINTYTLAQCPQEDIDFTDVSVTDCSGTFSFDGQLCPSDQIFFELEQDILVPTNTQINWYRDTDGNVDFDPANFVGVSEITTNPSTVSPCNPCPELLGVMVDACQDIQGSFNFGPEPNNEFVVIGSAGGFNTSELSLNFDSANNFEPGGTPPGSNADIGDGEPCSLTFPSTAIISNVMQSLNCVDVFAAGPNTDIPPGAIFLLFTSCAATPYYDFEELCANGAPIYIAQSTCCRTIGAFTNGSDSGFRTTILDFDCGCNSTLTHDTGNPVLQSVPPTSGGGIVYYDINDNLVYELTDCVAPPVNLIPLPPATSNVAPFSYFVTPEDCGNTITLQGILSPTFEGCDESLTPTFEFTVVCETPTLGEATICVGETVDLEDLLDPQYPDGFWFDNTGQLIDYTATEVGDQEISFFSTDCCVLQTSTTITVTDGTSVMVIPDTLICPGQAEINLDGLILESTLPDGEWSGVGVTGNIFDPSGFQDEIIVVAFDPEECGPFSNINITIAEAPEEIFTESICPSDSIEVNGIFYGANNNMESQLIAADTGCDTLLTIMLDFYEQPESTYLDSICSNGSLMVGDSIFNASKLNGTVIFSGATAEGCDSLVNVEISLKAVPPEEMIMQAICPGDSLEIAGVFYHQNQLTGTETITAANGCDSTINIALALIEDANNNISFNLCANQDTMINAVLYNATNPTGRDTIENAAINGCDSIIIIDINFTDLNMAMPIEDVICEGDGYELIIGDQTFNENNPSGMGVLQGSNGCDSLIPVDLMVLENVAGQDIFGTYCAGSNYSITFGDETFDSSNTSGIARIPASNGCDSVFVVSLFYSGNIDGEDFETTQCAGSDYEITFGSTTFNADNPSGEAIVQTAEGCDSVFNVTINYLPSISGDDFFRQRCAGDGFEVTFGQDIFNESNPSGLATLQTADGCDSTFQVNLSFVSAVQGQDYTDSDCVNSGLEIIFGNQTFNESNPTGIATIPSVNGCDSTFNVILTFQDAVQGQDYTDSDCVNSGLEVTFGNQTFNESNPNGMATIPSANGCDSTFNVILTFQDAVQGQDYTDSDCVNSGLEVTFGTQTFNESNPNGMATIPSANGCDSTFNVILTFQDAVQGQDYTDSDCVNSGLEVTFGTQTFNESNPNGMATIPSANGCDSTFNVILTFQDAVQGQDYTDSDCVNSGLEVTFGTQTFNESNPNGMATIPSANGCDSTFNVILTFQDAVQGQDYTDSDCVNSGLEVTFGTQTFNESNPTGMATIPSANGCDSTFNVILTFQDAVQGQDYTDSDCVNSGLEVTFGTQTFNESNPNGMATIPSANGCDSTFNVILTFQDAVQGQDYTDSNCVNSGLEVTFGNQTFNESNPTGMATIPSVNGCDSTFNVILNFQDAVQGQDYTDSDCVNSGLEVTFGNQTFNESNPSGIATIPSANGCDSTFNVILTFQDAVQGQDYTDSDCVNSGLEVTFGNQTFNESNPTGIATVPSVNGCDSTFNVILTFQDAVQGQDYTDSDCVNSGLEVTFGTQTFNESNPTGMATIPSTNGCDSTFNVILTFQDAVQGQDYTDSDCVNSGLEVTFGNQTFNESNPTGMATIPSANGCDSTFNVILTFRDAVQGQDYTDSDCINSGLEVTFGNQTFNESNPTGVVTIPSTSGCDSTFNVILTFQDAVQGQDYTDSDCVNSRLEVTFGTQTFNESNPTGVATIPSANGCDSTFLVVLTFNETSSDIIEETYCVGDDISITVGTETFDETNPNGVAVLENQNEFGCDSIVNVNLTFEETIISLEGGDAVCEGDNAVITLTTSSNESFDVTLGNSENEIVEFTNVQNGFEINLQPNATTSYFITAVGGLDCSVGFGAPIEIQVSEIAVALQSSTSGGATLDCNEEGTGSIEAIVSGAIGNVAYEWNQGGNTSTIENLNSGQYNVVVTDDIGCTDTDSFEIVSGTPIELDFTLERTGCDGSIGIFTIFNIEGGSSDLYSVFLDDQFSPLSSPELPLIFSLGPGAHRIEIVDEFGCSRVEEFEIIPTDPEEVFLTVTEEQTIDQGESIPLFVEGNFPLDSIIWTPSESLSCDNCPNPIASPVQTTIYTVEAFDDSGCNASAQVLLRVDRKTSIYIPNVFSPNDDGINDLFHVFGGVDVAMVKEFSIYDRWGNQVFFAENIPHNNAQFGWNGKYRGKKMASDVFVYHGLIELIDGLTVEVKGNVTLIK